MAATTKAITERLIDMMVTSHKTELQKLVRSKKIEQRLADDMSFAYSEGAKHMLTHLTKMGIVEYPTEKNPEPSPDPEENGPE